MLGASTLTESWICAIRIGDGDGEKITKMPTSLSGYVKFATPLRWFPHGTSENSAIGGEFNRIVTSLDLRFDLFLFKSTFYALFLKFEQHSHSLLPFVLVQTKNGLRSKQIGIRLVQGIKIRSAEIKEIDVWSKIGRWRGLFTLELTFLDTGQPQQ